MEDYQKHELYLRFLDTWPIERIKEMTLEEYVSVDNKETFCQWIETKTRELGSIKGIRSDKFGIYKRKRIDKRSSNLVHDDHYSWLPFYSRSSRNEAFKNIKEEIMTIIQQAQVGDFGIIDGLHLTHPFKWKLAFLFSNERLIPLYKKDWLLYIVVYLGMEVSKTTTFSERFQWILDQKPPFLSVYEFASELEEVYKVNNPSTIKINFSGKGVNRNAVTDKSTNQQQRKGAESYVAQQIHNKLQLKLFNDLKSKYGEQSVFLEKNYIDIKVEQPEFIHLYEVKSASHPVDCVREALGQILLYSHRTLDQKKRKLIVVGQYPPSMPERSYIDFVKKNLQIEFDYEHLSLG